jgi:GDP-L-fucose synthase
MMARIQIAVENNAPEFWVWGSGKQTREVLFSEDAADGLVFLMENYDEFEPINLGSGVESSVAYLAGALCQVMGYRGQLRFDTNQPEGTPRKVLDVSRIHSLGWRPRTSFWNALYSTREAFLLSRKHV